MMNYELFYCKGVLKKPKVKGMNLFFRSEKF